MTPTDDITQTPGHTPEPWRIHRLNNGWPVITSDAHDIADLRLNGNGLPHVELNARRICAAVNACQGIGTEALERGIVAELLAKLKTLLEQIDEDVPTDITTRHFASAYDEALATLAKATGRAA